MAVPHTEAQPASAALCGVHVDQPAIGTCGRCGTYVCQGCIQWVSGEGVPFCSVCADKARYDVIPFEDTELDGFSRFRETVKVLFKAPRATFSRLNPGSPLPPLLFAVLCGLGHGLVMVAGSSCCIGCVALLNSDIVTRTLDNPNIPNWIWVVVLVGFLVIFPILALIYAFFVAGTYHLGVAMVGGGEGGFRESLRAGAYTQVLHLPLAPFSLVQNVPAIGPMLSLLSAGLALSYITYTLYHHAIGVHRIEPSKAMVPAAMPLISTIVLVGGFVILAISLALGAAFQSV